MTVKDSPNGDSRMGLGKELLDLLIKDQDGAWVALGSMSGDFNYIAPLTIDIPVTRLLLEEIAPSATGTKFLPAFQELYAILEKGHQPREIFLLSDGEAVPAMDGESIDALLTAIKMSKIPLSTIGVGSNGGGVIPDLAKISKPDFAFLAKMAEAGKGTFYRLGELGVMQLAKSIEKNLIQDESGGAFQPIETRWSPLLFGLAALLTLLVLRLNPR